MSIQIPAEYQPFVATAISSGRFQSEAEVLTEALRLLQQREELIRDIDEGLAELDRGEYTTYDSDSLHELAEDIKKRGRERLNEAQK